MLKENLVFSMFFFYTNNIEMQMELLIVMTTRSKEKHLSSMTDYTEVKSEPQRENERKSRVDNHYLTGQK